MVMKRGRSGEKVMKINGSGHDLALSQIIVNGGFQPPGLPPWHLLPALNTVRKENQNALDFSLGTWLKNSILHHSV